MNDNDCFVAEIEMISKNSNAKSFGVFVFDVIVLGLPLRNVVRWKKTFRKDLMNAEIILVDE